MQQPTGYPLQLHPIAAFRSEVRIERDLVQPCRDIAARSPKTLLPANNFLTESSPPRYPDRTMYLQILSTPAVVGETPPVTLATADKVDLAARGRKDEVVGRIDR